MRHCLTRLILSTSLFTGCAHMEIQEIQEIQEVADQSQNTELLIASDLVNALMQVDGYHPATTRLQIQETNDSFGENLHAVLADAGYDIQFVYSALGDRFVQYNVLNQQGSLDSNTKTYHLKVGDVQFKRDYQTIRGRVKPASKLLTKGADAKAIKTNDQIFKLVNSEPNSSLEEQLGSPKINVPVNSQPLRPAYGLQRVSRDRVVYESAIDLLVNGESTPSDYNPGDKLVFTIRAQIDNRLSCYYKDPDGNVIRVYPNRFTSQSSITAGELVHIPASDSWSIEASRAGTSDEIMCLSVEPAFESVMSEFESGPDLEPLSVTDFGQLLTKLKVKTGITPKTKQVSVRVN